MALAEAVVVAASKLDVGVGGCRYMCRGLAGRLC